jgi:hypothetical protein
VSDLGDLLELLDGAPRRVQTLQATMREWQHAGRWQEAVRRHNKGETGMMMVGFSQAATAESEGTARVTYRSPDAYRVEHDDGSASGATGGRSWHYHEGHGLTTADERTEIGPEPFLHGLLSGPSVVGCYELAIQGRATAAGRDVIRVTARRRRGVRHSPLDFSLAPAEDVALLVDAELGLLLSVTSLIDGDPFRVVEVVEIAVDGELPAGIFDPPDLPAAGSHDPPVFDHVQLHEAAARASFPVYAPAEVDRGWSVFVTYVAGSARSRLTEQVMLHYHRDMGNADVSVEQFPGGHAEWAEHSETMVERGGRTFRTAGGRESENSWSPCRVLVSLDGTDVVLRSNTYSIDQLIDFAQTLVPAPTDPPSLPTG